MHVNSIIAHTIIYVHIIDIVQYIYTSHVHKMRFIQACIKQTHQTYMHAFYNLSIYSLPKTKGGTASFKICSVYLITICIYDTFLYH